jgi:EAL domain-containing protein (putative c-di-GMP-specific phosphodiesterase class I)
VRWISPTRGFVSPGEFIPLAEETGLIIPLGQWILQEACRQTKIWHERFPQHPSLTISINISSRQFSQADLAEQIAIILSQTDLDPNSVKLEITESMVMNDVKEALILLEKLKSLGLRLSMDDFGTGYSSLSYLHRFPMDTLKIDQSFVRQMEESTEDAEIVKTIVLLGHNLSMDIVAEGIETETQMQTLRSLNCEYGQGYFFSKPLPSDSATLLLSNFPQMLK